MEKNEKDEYQAILLKNRVQKKFRVLRKWARKNLITCFRLYDRDIPEIPLAIDLYEFLPEEINSPQEAAAFVENQVKDESQNVPGAAQKRLSRTYLKIFLYERPPQHKKSDAEEVRWLSEICASLSDALEIERSHIVCKIRRHEKGGSQYSKENSSLDLDEHSAWQNARTQITGCVFENGSIFFLNLSEYIDTGLFLDMRKMRALVKSRSQGKRVLNLFCYTSSFSVAAASGGAAEVESVDLSNTYLEWSKKNFSLNGINGMSHKAEFKFFRSDAFEFLEEAIRAGKKFDIIILDPPTFSNSKKMRGDLDLNRDWSTLANLCIKILAENGSLFFSTNSRRLSFERNLLEENALLEVAEITDESIDMDFEQKRPHRVWEIKKAARDGRL